MLIYSVRWSLSALTLRLVELHEEAIAPVEPGPDA
jgi:hypothetical protein